MSPSHDTIDLWQFADTERSLSGRIPLADLPRLLPALAENDGEVEFDLHFDRDPKSRARVRGTVRAVLSLQCQRCLETVSLPVEAQIHLIAVEGPEEAERLPDECNPLLIEHPKVHPAELVEDELLLALPLVPMHPDDACRPAKVESDEDAEQADGPSTPPNPFAVLAGLKKH